MIKVNKHIPQTVEHFDNQDNSLGFLNEVESLDLRLQIAEQNEEGYYLIFEEQKLMIDNLGQVKSYPQGLYQAQMHIYAKLFQLRKTKINDNNCNRV